MDRETPPPPDGPRRPRPALSPRERQVLRLLWEGYALKEIAGQLGLGYHSVRDVRERIGMKWQLHSTVAILRAAIEEGLIHP